MAFRWGHTNSRGFKKTAMERPREREREWERTECEKFTDRRKKRRLKKHTRVSL